MVMHTLNATAGSEAFEDCLRLAKAGDSILLLGDGVYSAVAGGQSSVILAASPADVLVLEDDAAAAGIQLKISDFPLVDMDDFVSLSERYPRQLAWY